MTVATTGTVTLNRVTSLGALSRAHDFSRETLESIFNCPALLRLPRDSVSRSREIGKDWDKVNGTKFRLRLNITVRVPKARNYAKCISDSARVWISSFLFLSLFLALSPLMRFPLASQVYKLHGRIRLTFSFIIKKEDKISLAYKYLVNTLS